MTDVSTDPTTTATTNTVTWWEIPVQDLEQAKTFFTNVFGWGYVPFGEGYEGILAGEQMIGGLSASEEPVSDGVRIYVQVEDLEGTLATVAEHGGSVKTPRTEVGGDMGWWANFTDPDGRVIGLATNNAAA